MGDYAFLQNMSYTSPFDCNDRELGCLCPRGICTDEIDYRKRKEENTNFCVGELFGLEPLSTIRRAVHVIGNNYSMK